MGQNFSWIEQIGHGFDQQRIRRQRAGNFETKTEVFASASRSKATAKPRRHSTILLILQNFIYSWKIMDWHWIRSSIRSGVPSGKKIEHSSSAWTFTSKRRCGDRIVEIERGSSEQIWALSTLAWRYVEEQDGRRRRQREKIPILYWPVRTRNSLTPSSLRSFRTKFHWSYISGQCVNSERFLQVHLSYWMRNQFAFHHKFRIESGRTKFKQGKTDGILYGCESHGQGSHRSARAGFDQATSCIVQAEVEKHQERGRFWLCSTKRIEVLSIKM